MAHGRRGFNRDREFLLRHYMENGDLVATDTMTRGFKGGRAALARQATNTLRIFGGFPFSEGFTESVGTASHEPITHKMGSATVSRAISKTSPAEARM